jgi:hypothetical protein
MSWVVTSISSFTVPTVIRTISLRLWKKSFNSSLMSF